AVGRVRARGFAFGLWLGRVRRWFDEDRRFFRFWLRLRRGFRSARELGRLDENRRLFLGLGRRFRLWLGHTERSRDLGGLVFLVLERGLVRRRRRERRRLGFGRCRRSGRRIAGI